MLDFVTNSGRPVGPVAEALAGARYEPNLMRPFLDKNGNRCVMVRNGHFKFDKKLGQTVPQYEKVKVSELQANGQYWNPVYNATSLRRDEWEHLDTVVVKAARQRLRAYSDLAGASTYTVDGMSKSLLITESMSDGQEAAMDMWADTDTRQDRPLFQPESLPLAITHSGFYYSSRELNISRNIGEGLDTHSAEQAGRRIGEYIEQVTIGTVTGLTYGATPTGGLASQIFGYTNFTDRNTKTDLTTPTGSNPDATVADVLAMRQALYDDRFYGPYMLYHSTDWDEYMDDDYVTGTAAQGLAAPNVTLRDRLRRIGGVQDVRRLDFFTDTFSLLLVEMTPQVARAVVGLPMTTVQWQSMGGLRENFKVMTIQVPNIRSDYNNRCGIIHATTA